MIDPSTRDRWRLLESKLRPFIARRVCSSSSLSSSSSDVDDIVQDVFLRMNQSIATLKDDERFGPWVYQVARSAIGAHKRKSARQPLLTSEQQEEEAGGARDGDHERGADEADEADESSAERELASYVALFISMLPSPYREALTLTELEGLTQSEAAKMAGVPLSTMKSRCQRGRRQLRDLIEDCCTVALDARGRVLSCAPRPNGHLPTCRCHANEVK